LGALDLGGALATLDAIRSCSSKTSAKPPSMPKWRSGFCDLLIKVFFGYVTFPNGLKVMSQSSTS
jgi:hypothetical protein